MISEKQFTRTKLATVMSYEAFKVFDKAIFDSQKVPDHVKVPSTKRFLTSKGANLLTTIVMWYLNHLGYAASRINVQGQLRKVKGNYKWVHSGSSRGVADIIAPINGKYTELEIKFGKDRLSDVQIKHAEKVKASGGEYHIIRTFDDLLNIMKL